MKKTIAILLVAIMAIGSAFAALTGSAQVGFGVDFDNGTYGFIDNSNSVGVNFELANMSGEAVGEGDIYASIKGSLVLEVFSGEDGKNDDDGLNGTEGFVKPATWKNVYIGLGASIDEAKIAGANWYVSLLGASDAPDYAKSAIDTWDKAVKKYEIVTDSDGATGNASLGIGWQGVEKGKGVEVGIYDYVIGGAFYGDWKKDTIDAIGYVATPSYDFNGLTLQVAAAAAKGSNSGHFDGGISAKVGFANDTISTSVATDMVLAIPTVDTKDVTFDADVAANFTYDFLTFDAYYGTNPVTGKTPKKALTYEEDGKTLVMEKDKYKLGANKNDAYWKERSENMLSAQVKVDLNSFEIPVAVTLGMNDILAKQAMTASVEVTPIDGLKLTVNGGYTINDDGRTGKDKAGVIKDYTMVIDKDAKKVGKWTAGMSGEYSFAYGKVTAGLSLEQKLDAKKNLIVGANAAFENSTLIPGATLKFAWADAKDMLGKDTDKTDFGKITASVSMTF